MRTLASCRSKQYYYDYVATTVKSVRRKLYKRDRLLKGSGVTRVEISILTIWN